MLIAEASNFHFQQGTSVNIQQAASHLSMSPRNDNELYLCDMQRVKLPRHFPTADGDNLSRWMRDIKHADREQLENN